VKNRHSGPKDFLRRHKGGATKYLPSYLKWFHLAVLNPHPPARLCLNAVMGA
jgi:hypothetical protein